MTEIKQNSITVVAVTISAGDARPLGSRVED